MKITLLKKVYSDVVGPMAGYFVAILFLNNLLRIVRDKKVYNVLCYVLQLDQIVLPGTAAL